MVHPALLPLMRTPRLPVVDWTDVPADLNGLVRFAERRDLVSARVPSRFKRRLLLLQRRTRNFSSKRWYLSAFLQGIIFRVTIVYIYIYTLMYYLKKLILWQQTLCTDVTNSGLNPFPRPLSSTLHEVFRSVTVSFLHCLQWFFSC